MTKGSKSSTVGDVGKEKATKEEKGKNHFCTRIGMDFDPKTSRLRNQEDVNKHLARYEVCLNPGIKVEFCPHGIDVSHAPAQW